jgi:hypothetical protein
MCVYLKEAGWVSCEPEFHYVNGDMQDYFESTGFVPEQDRDGVEPF